MLDRVKGALGFGCSLGFYFFIPVALIIWVAWPAGDQVCRMHKAPLWDAITGAHGQPTCQELLDQLDGQAAEARRREADLEARVEELESRLNM